MKTETFVQHQDGARLSLLAPQVPFGDNVKPNPIKLRSLIAFDFQGGSVSASMPISEPTSGPEFELYSYFRSSASYRVRIAMNMKGIAYEYKAVHLLNQGGEQNQASYGELNPSRQVPTLVHNGQSIGQSVAIIEYLDAIQPQPRLFPEDPYDRALVMQACEIVNSGAQPLHNLKVLQELTHRFGADQQATNDWSAFWIKLGCEALEKFLAPHAGDFAFRHSISAADCFIVPHLTNADRFKVSLSSFPTLQRIRKNCAMLDAFKRASPEAQPDTPQAP